MARNRAGEPTGSPNDDILKPAEAAAILGISKRSVLYHLNAGRIPGRKLGQRWLILRSAVDRIIEEARTGAGLGVDDVV